MKMKQKLFFAVLILFAAGFFGCDGDSGSSSPKIEQFTESFQADYQTVSIRALRVSAINGQINIMGYDGNDIQLSGLKRADAAADLEKIELRVTEENNVIFFNVVHDPQVTEVAIDLDLMVPQNIIVEEIDNVNGPVDVAGMDLVYDVRTANGSIRVDISGTDGDSDLGSANGKIDVFISTDLNATIDIRTANGAIDLNNVPLKLTVNQPKQVTGDLGAGGDIISISTANGNIELHRL